ncbi:hypothetical protein [Geotalea toluenoxydans]|uniref:hypothetical protein n=1 Tax=Geotalea toluenoxydans TaxID=421624 RepID=UPI0006D1DFAB|nr:hypothetical protein [Geotalea toluenoxydans]
MAGETETKSCSVCAETIRRDARKCKVCGCYQTSFARAMDVVSSSFGVIAVIVSVCTTLYVTYVTYASISGRIKMFCRLVDNSSIAINAGKTGNIPATIEKVTMRVISRGSSTEPKELARKEKSTFPVVTPRTYSTYIYQNEASDVPTAFDPGGDSECKYEITVLFRDLTDNDTTLKETLPCIK